MKKKKTHIVAFDYGSIVLSFIIFMLAWLNGNLSDMPWYGLLLTILLSIATVLTIFSVLNMRGHRRLAIAFGIILLLLSVPSAMHRAYGELSIPETILFYTKQVYLPLLAGTALFCLFKKKMRALWQVLLQWGPRIYAVLGIMLGILILHAELTRSPEITYLAEQGGESATMIVVATGIGIILAVAGLILNPLYVVWRNAEKSKGK